MANPGIRLVLQHLCQVANRQATDGMPDQQLLERYVAERDEDAFTALVHRHGPMVVGVCRRQLRELHDAEDAFQATFLVLARKAASIRRAESVGSWLHGVALRVANKARLSAARRACREQQRPAPAPHDASDAICWGELRAVLDEELGRLPASCSTPLVLCYLEGQTQDEAARRLGCSKSTFRRRLERGRRLLQSRLVRRGLTLSAGLVTSLVSEPATATALPAAFTAVTVKTALEFGRNPTVGTSSMGKAVALAESVLKGMALAQCKLAAVVLLAVGLLAVSGLGAYQLVTEKTKDQEKATAPEAARRNQAQPAAAPRTPLDQFGDPLPAEALARLGTVRLQHGAPAYAIAFAPDGRSLASAGSDGIVHIWEAATGKELLRIDNEQFPDSLGFGLVTGLAYAPDGKTLAGARLNQPACLWDVATGKELRQFGGDRHRARWVVFAPDGKTLAYGGWQDDPIIRLADVNTGNDLQQLGGHKEFVVRVAFSPDGTILASADVQTIHFFELATGRTWELARPDGQMARFSSLAFFPDGKTLAAGSEAKNFIQVVEVATGKALRTIPPRLKQEEKTGPIPILLTPDGKTVISGHDDGFVRFWEAASGTLIREFRAHPRTVVALALSPDGQKLATSGNDHTTGEHAVRLWETATGKPLVRHPGPQKGIAFLAFSPNSQRVATASWEEAVHLWEAATGKLLQHWDLFGPLAFSPDGQTLICGDWSDGKVHLLDLTTGKETRQFLAHANGIRSVSVARDGKTLATTGNDEFCRLWDLATGKQVQDFGGKQKGFVFRLALSPDAKLLASIHHQDHVVRIWETATGKLLREHPDTDNIGSIAFSPDGKLLASTFMGDRGRNPLIRLREVATGKEIRQLQGQGDPLDAVAFSPDGRTLIWGGQHRKDLYLWEVATGQLRHTFHGHTGLITSVAFSPNGRMMASGSSDASVLIWDAAGQRQRLQPSPPLDTTQLDSLWNDLAADNAVIAYQATCTLRASPRQAVLLCEQHLKPAPQADAKRVAEALRNLDSDQFAIREKAAKELESQGEAAEPALRRALAGQPSAEVRSRVLQLLERFEGKGAWRRERALELLEHIGGPEARRVLTTLAQGAPQARLTAEAQAALDRLGR